MIHSHTPSESYHFQVALERQLEVSKEDNPFYDLTNNNRNSYLVYGNSFKDITEEDMKYIPIKELAFLILKNITFLNDGKYDTLEKRMLKTFIEKRKKELTKEEFVTFKKLFNQKVSKSTVRNYIKEYYISPKAILISMDIAESYLDFSLRYVDTVNDYYTFLQSI